MSKMNEQAAKSENAAISKDSSKGIPLSITTDPDIKVWVEKMADSDDRSVSKFLTRLLRAIMKGEQITLPS